MDLGHILDYFPQTVALTFQLKGSEYTNLFGLIGDSQLGLKKKV